MKEEDRNRILKVIYPLIARVTRCAPLAESPALYFPYARLFRRPSPASVTPWSLPNAATELVIEEPGSCGNHSFAAYFIKHNPSRKLATLTHCAAPVIYAARHGIPCIVLTRDIMGYVDSCVARFPHLYTPRVATLCYTSFFRSVMTVRDRVVVACLHEIAQDPRPVIEAVNRKFGTAFEPGDGVLPRIRSTAYEPAAGYRNPEGADKHDAKRN